MKNASSPPLGFVVPPRYAPLVPSPLAASPAQSGGSIPELSAWHRFRANYTSATSGTASELSSDDSERRKERAMLHAGLGTVGLERADAQRTSRGESSRTPFCMGEMLRTDTPLTHAFSTDLAGAESLASPLYVAPRQRRFMPRAPTCRMVMPAEARKVTYAWYIAKQLSHIERKKRHGMDADGRGAALRQLFREWHDALGTFAHEFGHGTANVRLSHHEFVDRDWPLAQMAPPDPFGDARLKRQVDLLAAFRERLEQPGLLNANALAALFARMGKYTGHAIRDHERAVSCALTRLATLDELVRQAVDSGYFGDPLAPLRIVLGGNNVTLKPAVSKSVFAMRQGRADREAEVLAHWVGCKGVDSISLAQLRAWGFGKGLPEAAAAGTTDHDVPTLACGEDPAQTALAARVQALRQSRRYWAVELDRVELPLRLPVAPTPGAVPQ